MLVGDDGENAMEDVVEPRCDRENREEEFGVFEEFVEVAVVDLGRGPW